ncbi:MAG: AAA family ATPase [Acidobacteriaceae bacterium]
MIAMPNDSQIVIGVAGRIGSGKSVVAHALERDLGFQYLRYSMVLAEWFAVDPNDKTRLQEIGGEVMSGDGQRELNRRLIARIDRGRDVVVDGLRHPTDYESLQSAFASRFALIFVDTPRDIRRARTRERYRTEDAFRAADSRPVEENIDLLRPMAAAVISGTMTAGQLTAELQRLSASFRHGVGT